MWSSAEQQQNYLPGIPEGSDLRITPISAPENHYVRINANNKIDAKGTLTGQFTITAEGQSDSNVRRTFTRGWQSQWQNDLESQLLAVSPKARLISVDYGKDPKNYQAAPIKITFRYEIPEYAVEADNTMLLKPLVMNNLYNSVKSFLRIDTDLKTREYGFKDGCSRLVELDENIQLPAGYKMVSNAKKDSKQSGAADFEGSLSSNGNKVVLHVTAQIDKRDFPANDLFASLPPGLFSNLDGLEADGTLTWHFLLDVDFTQIDSLKFESTLKSRNFRIVKQGKTDLRKMNEPFMSALTTGPIMGSLP